MVYGFSRKYVSYLLYFSVLQFSFPWIFYITIKHYLPAFIFLLILNDALFGYSLRLGSILIPSQPIMAALRSLPQWYCPNNPVDFITL